MTRGKQYSNLFKQQRRRELSEATTTTSRTRGVKASRGVNYFYCGAHTISFRPMLSVPSRSTTGDMPTDARRALTMLAIAAMVMSLPWAAEGKR